MNLATIRNLLDYGDWAIGRLFAQIGALTPEQFVATPIASLPSIRHTLTHTLGAEVLWLSRFRTGSSAINITEEQFPDFATFRQEWDVQRAALRAHLDTLDDEALAEPFRFERRGVSLEWTLWKIFYQLINHEMQHRTEIAAILTELGHSPGDLDFFIYIMEQERAA